MDNENNLRYAFHREIQIDFEMYTCIYIFNVIC